MVVLRLQGHPECAAQAGARRHILDVWKRARQLQQHNVPPLASSARKRKPARLRCDHMQSTARSLHRSLHFVAPIAARCAERCALRRALRGSPEMRSCSVNRQRAVLDRVKFSHPTSPKIRPGACSASHGAMAEPFASISTGASGGLLLPNHLQPRFDGHCGTAAQRRTGGPVNCTLNREWLAECVSWCRSIREPTVVCQRRIADGNSDPLPAATAAYLPAQHPPNLQWIGPHDLGSRIR